MKLKQYQQQTIDTLSAFFKEARVRGPQAAFTAITSEPEQAKRLRGYGGAYKPVKGLEAVPYVCLRLPTGGGKTLLAAHAIAHARDHWMEQQYPVVVWLVPSDAIRRQTVEALKDPRHPYRQSLDDAFEGRVRVFDIGDFTQATPQDLRANLCVFVGTIQTLKVSNTNGRKVYAHNEMMEPHFSAVSPNTAGLERNDDGPMKGDIRFSFANLLHMHRPLVIVDEAHTAVTGLAHEMQQRLNPSAIIEMTATPRGRSNILHSVTAQELKDEQMIKMPVVLEEHKSWQSAVNGAILKRAELEEIAKRDREAYIRPIILFQAQNKDQEVTVEVLRDHLVDVKGIPPESIAVVTGNQRELNGITLSDPDCPIDYVITVQALKEGWDCSFAYVFCSVANISSAGDAEQLLGRVLRMPYATRRSDPALNKSYACLNSPSFQEAVRGLVDRLVDMGFEESEVQDNIEHAQPELLDGLFDRQTRAKPSFQVVVDAPAAELKGIETVAPHKIKVGPDESGNAKISVTDYPTPDEETRLFAAIPVKHHGVFREELEKFKAANNANASPAQRGETFVAPCLMAEVQGELVFADNAHFLEFHDWSLSDHSHQLSETEFSIRQVAETFEIDLDGDRLTVTHSDQTEQLSLDIAVEGWTEQGLVQWLDRKVRDRFIGQGELIRWLGAVVSNLTGARGIPLSSLMRCQFVLARCLQKKLIAIYEAESTKSYQMNLFGQDAAPSISYDNGFKFFDGMFAGVRLYRGRQRFRAHFTGNGQVPAFDGKGENGSEGEEIQCAVALDSIPDVKHWIRNVPKHPNAFFLPRASGRHYPDFVAELNDGRTLVVEYKGQRGKSDPKEIEALNIGKKWQAVSGGKAIYCRVEKELNGLDMRAQIIRAIQ
ncbi:DEAD/DEAH box helicase family protein [Abyssibius alkaniclasticus]|uniref:DEAD/DEAH box helicase n=1 Tax=Abyssibius alkaniclasticus TaxID=2881234 RepID=UPI0023640150|nr:DEAD/DEAH box helicase family protein [Abyssibius alkaniclasticus]UPH70155.1 DEAD/DEAH box helicase family protein [Abyssibius alkaniclasticus]